MSFNAMKNPLVSLLALSMLISSCRKDVVFEEEQSLSAEQSSMATGENPLTGKWKQFSPKIRAKNASLIKTDRYYQDLFENMEEGVDPSECRETKLDRLIAGYLEPFEFWDYVLFGDFLSISQLYATIDKSKQYFGARGEYTHLVNKQQRRLESFWDIDCDIRVNGQHNATLSDREKIAKVFIVFSEATREDGLYIADQVIALSQESKVFPETPLLTFDAFATPDRLIVMGDGLIKALAATGVDDDAVVSGILSHEWSHQVQFENLKSWYGFTAENRPQTPAFNRQMELEADFFSAYFLTHKKGKVFKWKKVEEFNQLFFNLGDCSFTSPGHHGTPRQRVNAARLGYSIACESKDRGRLLSARKLHRIFMENIHRLL